MTKARSLIACTITARVPDPLLVERQGRYLAELGEPLLSVSQGPAAVAISFSVGAREAHALIAGAPFVLDGIWGEPSAWVAAPLMDHGTCYPAGEVPAIRAVPMPMDQKLCENVFGGWVLSQIDHAAWKRARSRCASVALHMGIALDREGRPRVIG